MKYILFFVAAFVVSAEASAQLKFCQTLDITRVEVQARRDDGHAHQNSMILRLKKPCAGSYAVYMKQKNPMFSAMLAVALAAKTSGKPVWLFVNDSTKIGSGTLQISAMGIAE